MRKQRRFVPCLDRLEPVLSLTPTFVTDPNAIPNTLDPDCDLYLGSLSYSLACFPGLFGAGQDDGSPTMEYDLNMTDQPASSDAPWPYADPNTGAPLIFNEEESTVDNAYSGPSINGIGGGLGQDNRPPSTSQVVFAVTHMNTDIFNNFTQGPIQTAPLTTIEAWSRAMGSTVVDFTGSPVDLQNYGIEVHFHATYDSTNSPFFTAAPDLTLHVGNYISFYVDPVNGFLANEPGGLVDYFDPNFGSGNGGPPADVDEFYRFDGNPIAIWYTSDLVSYPVAPLPPGATMNVAHFQWTLTLQPFQRP
jgi:hypothetical protein